MHFSRREHFLFQADLEDAGLIFDFQAFTRAEDALGHLQEQAYPAVLVLTDLGLAGCDAVDFIRQARAHVGMGGVGVYSGAKSADREEECRKAGASFYLVKPASLPKLVDAVEELEGLFTRKGEDGRLELVHA